MKNLEKRDLIKISEMVQNWDDLHYDVYGEYMTQKASEELFDTLVKERLEEKQKAYEERLIRAEEYLEEKSNEMYDFLWKLK